LLGWLCAPKVPPMTTEHIQVDDVTPRIAYTATSGQTEFAVPFVFFDDADLKVYQNGTLKTLTTHYTVTGEESNDDAARKVTLVTGATVGDSIVIVRDIAIARTTDQPDSGPFSIRTNNTELDRLVAMMQQLENNDVRAVRVPDSDPVDDLELPTAAARASKYLFFDADGDPTAVASVTSSAAVAAFWVTVLQTATAPLARTALGITDTTAYTGDFNFHNCDF
jgi:hypothetical protein